MNSTVKAIFNFNHELKPIFQRFLIKKYRRKVCGCIYFRINDKRPHCIVTLTTHK